MGRVVTSYRPDSLMVVMERFCPPDPMSILWTSASLSLALALREFEISITLHTSEATNALVTSTFCAWTESSTYRTLPCKP